MSLPSEGSSHTKREYPPLIIPKRTIFTEEERKELKQIINEALDERGKKEAPAPAAPTPPAPVAVPTPAAKSMGETVDPIDKFHATIAYYNNAT